MQETTEAGLRCPQCSAAVRPGAPWCTQCYAPVEAPVDAPVDVPVRARAGTAPAPEAAVPPAPAPAVTVTSADGAASTGTWPCTACAQPNDLADAACAACGTPFLAAVREQRPSLVLPVVGDLLELTPVRRVGLAAAAVVAFLVVTVLLGLLLA